MLILSPIFQDRPKNLCGPNQNIGALSRKGYAQTRLCSYLSLKGSEWSPYRKRVCKETPLTLESREFLCWLLNYAVYAKVFFRFLCQVSAI